MDESRNYSMSKAALAQRQQAPLKHSVHAFQRRGPDALNAQQISRLAELRQLVEDETGRRYLRVELTARMFLLCELGFAHMGNEAEAGRDIWAGGLIRRLATYVSETRRLMNSLGVENSMPDSITEYLVNISDDEQA